MGRRAKHHQILPGEPHAPLFRCILAGRWAFQTGLVPLIRFELDRGRLEAA